MSDAGDAFVVGGFLGCVLTFIFIVFIVFGGAYNVYDTTGEIIIKPNKEYYKLTKATDEEILKYIKENK